MAIVTAFQRLASAATVFFGRHGAVAEQARQRGVCRQALYREADRALDDLDGSAARAEVEQLRQRLAQLQARCEQLEARLAEAVVLDRDQQARFASAAQGEGVSLPVARRLLAPLLGARTPSVAQLGRWSQAVARQVAPVLAVLDEVSRPRAEQGAGDEIFFGRKPCLMLVEQHSLCWLSGRLADKRDGAEWAQEFRQLPRLRQLTRDAGQGLAKGLALVNAERRERGQEPIADQEDHFHALREGGRALRRMQARAARLLAKAEAAQRAADERTRQRGGPGGLGGAAAKAWRAAERAVDRWSGAEKAWARVGEALRLFTPQGVLNTRARAEAVLAAALPALSGAEWAKARRSLQRPELLTFLDRAGRELASLPVGAELREAAVRVEGLRRRPQALRGEGASAGALRAALLAAELVLALSGEAGRQALASVRGVLGGVWRASSLVECLNSVARMQQSRHRRMTQGLLDLKRLYWNCREFRTGRRRGKTPYGLLGVELPTSDWWELLKLTPEQLRQQLSAPKLTA